MKFTTKDEKYTLTIKDNTIVIREGSKRYTFTIHGVRCSEATSIEHYTWYVFNVGNASGYQGCHKFYSSFSLGVNEFYNEVTFTATFIKELKKTNKAVLMSGSMKANGTEVTAELEKYF